MCLEFGRKDLQKDYIWSRDDGDGEYTGILDRMKVDIDEGYEVLHLINSILKELKIDNKNDALKIEEFIHEKPYDMVSREKIKKFVENKYILYKYSK